MARQRKGIRKQPAGTGCLEKILEHMQDANDRMQGVVPVELDEDKDYWNSTMETMAKDCYGVHGAAARIHLKTELQACISRFKQGIDDGVNLPCADLQPHTQKLFMVAQPPTPATAPSPAPVPAQPLNMQGPFLTPQQVAQLQAMQGTIGPRPQGSSTPIQNVNFGPRPPAPTTPTTNLDMSMGDSFISTWLQQQMMALPSNSPAPPEKPSTSSTTQNQPRPS